MIHKDLFLQLARNKEIFHGILPHDSEEFQTWRFHPDKWCLKEIVCHLLDEEREDFRSRIKHCFETPDEPMPPINPQAWVMERDYMGRNIQNTYSEFRKERENSIAWFISLVEPNWKSTHHHPQLGAVSAEKFLANWVEHDFLHIRQIFTLKHQYLAHTTSEDLSYAGNW
ncbi:MAG: DinB family protein [Flavobacteriales bacterium]|nr:DinB family protein [Flavobacteriales bacterium]